MGGAEEVLSEVYSPSGMGCSPQAGTRRVPARIREKLKIRTEHLFNLSQNVEPASCLKWKLIE